MVKRITQVLIDTNSIKDGESIVTIDSNGKIVNWHFGVGEQPDIKETDVK